MPTPVPADAAGLAAYHALRRLLPLLAERTDLAELLETALRQALDDCAGDGPQGCLVRAEARALLIALRPRMLVAA